MSTRLTIRLDFELGRRLGAGKIALLESIDKTGSISAGAALTEQGRRIVALYREAEAKMRTAARREIDAIESALATGGAEVR